MSRDDNIESIFTVLFPKHYYPMASELFVRTFSKDKRQFVTESLLLESILLSYKSNAKEPDQNARDAWNYSIWLCVITYQYMLVNIHENIRNTKGLLPTKRYAYFKMGQDAFTKEYAEFKSLMQGAKEEWDKFRPETRREMVTVDLASNNLSPNEDIQAKLIAISPPKETLFNAQLEPRRIHAIFKWIEACYSAIKRMVYYYKIHRNGNKIEWQYNELVMPDEEIPEAVLERFYSAVEKGSSIERNINMPKHAKFPKTRGHLTQVTFFNTITGFVAGVILSILGLVFF